MTHGDFSLDEMDTILEPYRNDQSPTSDEMDDLPDISKTDYTAKNGRNEQAKAEAKAVSTRAETPMSGAEHMLQDRTTAKGKGKRKASSPIAEEPPSKRPCTHRSVILPRAY